MLLVTNSVKYRVDEIFYIFVVFIVIVLFDIIGCWLDWMFDEKV